LLGACSSNHSLYQLLSSAPKEDPQITNLRWKRNAQENELLGLAQPSEEAEDKQEDEIENGNVP